MPSCANCSPMEPQQPQLLQATFPVRYSLLLLGRCLGFSLVVVGFPSRMLALVRGTYPISTRLVQLLLIMRHDVVFSMAIVCFHHVDCSLAMRRCRGRWRRWRFAADGYVRKHRGRLQGEGRRVRVIAAQERGRLSQQLSQPKAQQSRSCSTTSSAREHLTCSRAVGRDKDGALRRLQQKMQRGQRGQRGQREARRDQAHPQERPLPQHSLLPPPAVAKVVVEVMVVAVAAGMTRKYSLCSRTSPPLLPPLALCPPPRQTHRTDAQSSGHSARPSAEPTPHPIPDQGRGPGPAHRAAQVGSTTALTTMTHPTPTPIAPAAYPGTRMQTLMGTVIEMRRRSEGQRQRRTRWTKRQPWSSSTTC